MSMLSAQIDELREYADRADGTFPLLASALRDAADTIWQLRDDLQRTNAENAELREQMERLVTLLRVDCDIDASWDGLRRFWSIGLTENGCLMRDRACKAEAENVKLREQIYWLKKGDILHVLTDQEYIDQCERERLMQVSIDALDAENAKLREAAGKLYSQTERVCTNFRSLVGRRITYEAVKATDADLYEIRKMLKDMGIEVE